MRGLALGLIAFAWLCASAPARAQDATGSPQLPVRQVILVQNSGWMEPFYQDPRSRFRELITSLAAQSNLQGVDLVIATFNQDGQVPGRRSPEVLWEGRYEAGSVARAAEKIDLPRKPSGAYADADFHGAVRGVITRVLGGREGVIWMITNNKDSPNNSQTVVANTERFYDLLRSSPYITRIAAFPIRNELAGPNFREKGFIVYAFAYGPRGAKALDVILRDGSPTRALFRSPPVKLKPLDKDPVELRLAAAPTRKGPVAEVRNGVLDLRRVPGGKPSTVELRGVLRNTYYPQNIDSAAISLDWRSADPDLAKARVSLSPSSIRNVPALGLSEPVTLRLEIPKTPRRGPIFGLFDNDRSARGVLSIRLQDIDFSLDDDFLARLSAISGTEQLREGQQEALVSSQLPRVFVDYRRVSDATTEVPVSIRLHYSPWPLILLLIGTATLLGGGGFLLAWISRPRTYSVPVGSSSQTVSIRPFENRVASDGFGARARLKGSLFGPPTVRRLDEDDKGQLKSGR